MDENLSPQSQAIVVEAPAAVHPQTQEALANMRAGQQEVAMAKEKLGQLVIDQRTGTVMSPREAQNELAHRAENGQPSGDVSR